MTATNLPLIATLTDPTVTEAQFKTALTNLLAALRERGDPLGMMGCIQNLGLAFSVAGSALTCALKQRDGSTNADSTNVIAVPFRNATATSGAFIVRDVTAALSLTVSSGSTLGHSNGVASNTFWYLIDNSGTVELAVSSRFFGWSGIVSTTAEGGAGAADSATVMYSATARSNVPYICIAKTVDTQTTAGTWAAAPTNVYLAPFDLLDQASSYPGAEGTIASASTTDLGTVGSYIISITGTTTITSLGSSASTSNPLYFIRFAGALTLTHNATSLILPGNANITTAAGDTAVAQHLGSGNWRVRQYTVTSSGVTPAFSKSFTSSDQTITSAGTLTLAHGLGATPTLFNFRLVCQTGEFSFSAGNTLVISADNNPNFDCGMAVTYDSTNVYITFGSHGSVFCLTNKGTGNGAYLTNANWKLRVLAWA